MYSAYIENHQVVVRKGSLSRYAVFGAFSEKPLSANVSGVELTITFERNRIRVFNLETKLCVYVM